MDDLYREQILEHYKRPHNWGEMDEPDLEFEDSNPLCGDELRVMLRVGDDGTVEDVRFSGHGCAISQASPISSGWSARSSWNSWASTSRRPA